MTIKEPRHPFVMVTIIFLLCIVAGIIIGYMAINMPEFPDFFKKTEQPVYSGKSGYTGLESRGSYDTIYRSHIDIYYNEIPEDSKITNASISVYGGKIRGDI